MVLGNANILYGGDITNDCAKDVQSLGEYIIRELASHGDKVSIVSTITEKSGIHNVKTKIKNNFTD